MSLRQADKYVKEGNYEAALEAIAQARQLDPSNPYAIAYEERVRSLLRAQQQKSAGKTGTVSSPHEQAMTPHLEQISKLAIQREQSSAAAQSVNQRNASSRKREEEERLRQEELRRAAIHSKITTFMTRAQQYVARNEFTLALNELSRAILLDPENAEAHTLEQKARALQEESNKKKEQERIQREKEEEQKRQQQLQAEMERLQQEQEARKRKDEESRRLAQKEKVAQYIARSRELLQAGRLQEAQNELAFVVVMDPLNSDVAALGEQIRIKQEEIRQAELELRRKKEEEERKRLEELKAAIHKHIENANELAARGEFGEALRVITKAFVLDPINEELQECENKLIAQQEEAIRHAEEQRIAEEEANRQKAEEELKRREQAQREQMLHRTKTEIEAQQREAREKIQVHLDKARQHLANQQFEGALAEVALGFLIDPFHEEVKQLEQEVLAARSRASEQEGDTIPPPDESGTGGNGDDTIAGHVAEANRLRELHEYPQALEELAKAFILDPLNTSVQQCEDAIQKEFAEFQNSQRNRTGSGRKTDAPANPHVEQARKFIDKKAYDEALAEIALGLAENENDEELRKLEQDVWKLQGQSKPPAKDDQQDEEAAKRDRLIKIHLLAAEEFVKHTDFAKALDELAKAFVIDPLNSEVVKMEHRLRQQQLRHQRVPPQPLKLVYGGDKAAEA